MSGIYEIVHVATGRAYIGSSVDVRRRLRAHLALLRRGAHDNVWLQRTWDRDGEGAFETRFIERCATESLRDREAEIVSQRSGLPGVFNLSPVVRNGARAANASVPDEDVRAIYQRAAEGESVSALAAEYVLPHDTVRRIVFGRTYRRITGGSPARGRAPARGERINNAKLTADQVRDIRKRAMNGKRRGVDGRYVLGHPDSKAALAREYDVSVSTIRGIVEGKLWSHIR